MKGIRLLQTEINDQFFPITEKEINDPEANFYTVIIGNNAAGKSRLLVNILNGLRQAGNQRVKSLSDSFKLDFIFNGNEFTISNNNIGLFNTFSNDINLISISNSLFDKFPHQVKSDKNYSYVGIRMGGISTHRRAVVNDLMDILSNNLIDESFVKKAKQLFDFLKLKPIIKISLKTSFSSSSQTFEELIKNCSTIEGLRKYLLTISNQNFFRQQSNVIEKYAHDEQFVKGFYHYLKGHLSLFKGHGKNEFQHHEINLDETNKNASFIEEYRYFSLLRRLNIVNYNYIKLQKGKVEYDIQDSSTGEIGLLVTFLRAIPEMKSNSVIFIDEPEISLHPGWQMRYIDLLRNFLKGYTGCHVLIATHSHLLLSDLNEKWSSVVVLNNDNGEVTAELKKYTPFGWSPEAILYDIFGVINVRNHYFEYDLKKMLALCKNLLINKYESKINPWQKRQGIKILMWKILYYSNLHQPENISREKITVISEKKEKIIITIEEENTSVLKEDYLFLLEALEMVIAY